MQSLLKTKIIMIILLCITSIFIATNPLLGLSINQSNTQTINGTINNLNNGFVGSNYISYHIIQGIENNVTVSQITVSSFSLSGVMLIVLPIIWLIFTVVDDNKKVKLNKHKKIKPKNREV